MLTKQVAQFHECFESIEDPRVTGRCDHPLDSILFLVVTGVIAGAEGPADIEEFGIDKEDWISQFVDLPAGIPSHDTIGRVLSLIKPDQFQSALLDWVNCLRAENADEDGPIRVQIDGKTARGSYTDIDKSNALHIVSAWASQYGLTLGQVAVDSKSNEITAIPELLDMMDLKGTIVTLDAMGCQKSIAEKIIDEGGDYTFAVKDNHPKLCEAIAQAFEAAYEHGFSSSRIRSKQAKQKQAGRIEERYYAIGPIPDDLKPLASQWAGAKSIGQAITMTTKSGKESSEVRYYISSREAKVGEFADSIRSHWSIEAMHWILDVVFHEDASRIRTGNATENMSFVRRFVTTLLKQDTTKVSLKQKRKKAGWNTAFLEKLLFGYTF